MNRKLNKSNLPKSNLAIKNDKFAIVEYLCSRPEIEIHKQDSEGISTIHEAVRKPDLKCERLT